MPGAVGRGFGGARWRARAEGAGSTLLTSGGRGLWNDLGVATYDWSAQPWYWC
jgi:hypothetical protein